MFATIKLSKMKNNVEIFVSYAWWDTNEEGESREKIVDEICHSLLKFGLNVIRDKKDVGYKDDIKKFEERIGNGDIIILVISDKYLKSEHCMFEILKIKEHANMNDRIFPIVLKCAKIYNEIDRIDYINFWDDRINTLNKKIKTIRNPVGITTVIEKLNDFNDIRRALADITNILRTMNTLNLEMHRENNFEIIRTMITQNISKSKISQVSELNLKTNKEIDIQVNKLNDSRADNTKNSMFQYFELLAYDKIAYLCVRKWNIKIC